MAISAKQLARLLQPIFGATPMDAETLTLLAQDCSRYSQLAIERAIQTLAGCPTPLEFLILLDREARSIEMERIAAGYDSANPIALGECGCDGTGYTVIRDAGPDGPEVVRPCDVCLPEAFQRWTGGHYGEHRGCAECREMRGVRPRRKSARV